MILPWMRYAILIGICAVAGALALEPLAAARRWPRRLPWGAALALAIGVPLVIALRPARIAAVAADGVVSRMAAGVGGIAPVETSIDWDRWLLLAWLLASTIVLASLVASAWSLWRVRRGAPAVVIDGTAVAVTPDTGPGAVSFGRPRIVLPRALVTLDAPRRALLLRHEAEHVQAGDPQLLLASLVALVLMPWNPALWAIARGLRTALELDCDARVIARGADRRAYGDLLLTVAATRRPPRLAAYLAFAAFPSSLERRIRAMTDVRRTLTPLLQCSLGSVALVALVTACEARRPEPVAPVAILSVADGKTKSAEVPTGAAADSARRALTSEIRARVPAPALNGSASDPLLIVYDADGNTVLSGRLGARTASGRPALDSIPYPPEAIATVNVIKAGPLLPPEAKGGVIKVVLKRESGPYKRMAAADAPPAPPTREMLVVISDSEGREVYRTRLTTPTDGGAPDKLDTLVDPAAIASVDVVKSPDDRQAGRAEIRVTLKPGASLRMKR